MKALLDRRLVLVTGKGGVGKTTVAAALGIAAARRGRRTVVCEVAEQERLTGLFGRPPGGHGEVELAPGLFGLSIDPRRAMAEWLRHQLKSGTLAGVLGGSRIFQLLTAAAPGVSELVTMGKIWDLAQFQRRSGGSVFDLAIVDAPSTGHGLALLRAPGTYAHIARVGPIARQANQIDAFVRNPASTGLAVVALPEEMPVNETIELERRVRDDMGLHVDWILANAVLPERFSKAEVRSLLSAEEAARGSARAAAAASLSEHRRAAGQREQLERLRRGTSAPVTTLPFLFEPELGRAELEELSLLLEEAL